ncbi:response regulator [Sinorhizobium meliloti]|uniref:response regulator transcription factor n=1 Tax=Rhizobium meliloti TaxID=382 RepID=UPI000FD8A377|nr:response regulator transcription factor [Sinorhizobium meliloti]MQW61603.1 response regulator [Sinorhizobium meliloti]RVP09563.1 response regulator [Sinorhizobium meliloti]
MLAQRSCGSARRDEGDGMSGAAYPSDHKSTFRGDKMTSADPAKVRRVLLVEDDAILRNNYTALLSAHRFSVCACDSAAAAIAAFESATFDIIVLDVTLGSDYEAGFDLCRTFRERQKTVPIIFLTEHDEDADKISGLRIGADDYLSKTISGTYLTARITALIKRVETLASAMPDLKTLEVAAEGSPMRIDERLSRAFWDGSALELSLTQFWILRDLYRHKGEVRSTADLMRAANITVQPNTIVVHIKSIRAELQKHYPGFSCIRSERARGYRWIDE